MALGNANASAQARGKNKATKIRKRKEIELAASFTAFSTTVAETNTTRSCAISNSDINVPYFHDGSHVSNLPYQVGDKVYTRKRNNSKFYLADGFYKIGPDRGRYFSIKITNGAVASISTCP
tara:strand:+ start:803 stop:1168 length:366 start_codon:yes stop_codon:yes gene_type:complete